MAAANRNSDDNTLDANNNERVAPPESYAMEERPRLNTLETPTARTEEEMEEELELMYGAKHVILIFLPVGLCMAVVIATISSISCYSEVDGNYLIYAPFHPDEGDTGGKTLVKSLLNALIMIAIIAVMTFVLILLYKYRWYKVLQGWVFFSSTLILFMFGLVYVQCVLKSYNIPMDMITVTICLYNFGVMGIVSIHWIAPLKLQQAYLIISAALMALVFIRYLPEWTLWLVLGLLSIWDLIAVLTPHGPLKILIDIATERGEQLMPALIYSSTILYPIVTMAKAKAKGKRKKSKTPQASVDDVGEEMEQAETSNDAPAERRAANDEEVGGDEQSNQAAGSPANPDGVLVGEGTETGRGDRRASERIAQLEHDIEEAEERGVKLGLGDFIFYSVLVGKATALGEPIAIIASSIGILTGLFLTLAILVTARKALPALPISVAFGLLLYFGTRYFIIPMLDQLVAHQIFI